MINENTQTLLPKEQIESVMSLYSSGNINQAIERIKALNKDYPNVPLLFNLIGACYKALGQLEVAAKMFEKAVGIKPDYAEAHKNLGITLRSLGQLEPAVNSLEQAIKVEPNYVDAHYNLAITFKDFGDLDAAVKSYEKAITLNPNFAEAHNNLANALKVLGQVEEAIVSLKRALEIKPNSRAALDNLNLTFIELGRSDEFKETYNKLEISSFTVGEKLYKYKGEIFRSPTIDKKNHSFKIYAEKLLDNNGKLELVKKFAYYPHIDFNFFGGNLKISNIPFAGSSGYKALSLVYYSDSAVYSTAMPLDWKGSPQKKHFDDSTILSAIPTYYLISKKVKAVSGAIQSTTFTFGDYASFPTVNIDAANIANIIDVFDSNQNEYYEVDYLAQDLVFDSIKNTNTNDPINYTDTDTPYILKTKSVNRRKKLLSYLKKTNPDSYSKVIKQLNLRK